MSEPIENGSQTSPLPEVSEREKQIAELVKMNPDLGNDGSQDKQEDQQVADVKSDKPKPEAVTQENGQTGKSKSGYDRRISVLTKREKEAQEKLRQLEKEVAELRKGKSEPKKFSRESCASDEEYMEHLAEQKAEAKVREYMDVTGKKNEAAINDYQKQIQFEKTWQEKQKKVFGGNEAARQQYLELQQSVDPEEIDSDTYDFIAESPVAPLLHAVILSDAELRERLNSMTPIRRGNILLEIERRIEASMQGGQGSVSKPQKATTNAPDPVGSVSTGGSSLSDSELSWKEQLQKHAQNRK